MRKPPQYFNAGFERIVKVIRRRWIDLADFKRGWIDRAKYSEFGPIVRFAYGLQKDISTVAAAADTSWNTGQVEGQINRLKTLKRQMYGRAGFELLRACVLPYSPAASAGPAP